MNEAYQTALQHIKDRCKAHKVAHGDYPATLTVDEATWETLRAGIHASRGTTHFQIPLLEDQPVRPIIASTDAMRPLHMVTVRKEGKRTHSTVE